MKDEDKVIIMRLPCLMEDEGRLFFVRECSYKDAVIWIEQQKGEYFGPGDYKIYGTEASLL